jgi:hypothetical protein
MTNHGGKGGWREGQVKSPREEPSFKKWRLGLRYKKVEEKKRMMKRQEKEE